MDYYSTLGVDRNASQDEIKKAYRRLANQHHPDKGGDSAMFQKIQEAYSTLSDPQKKSLYDNPQPQFQGFPGGFGGAGFPGGGFHFQFGGDGFEDIFSIFRNQQNANRRPTYRTRVDITLKEAYTGTDKILELNTPQGRKVVNIKVPKGVNNNDQMKYDNLIDYGTLIIEFNILPDLRFERRGLDLYCNHEISVLDLIVGTSISFHTIGDKELNVQIKPKTQPNAQIKISAHGMPMRNTEHYGDQYILLKPYIPDNINQEIVDSILRNRSN